MLRITARPLARPARVAVAVAVMVALGACGGGDDPSSSSSSIGAEVTITDAAFSPDDVGVPAGGTVRWTSTSATERHNILPVVGGSFAKHESLIKPGEKVTITFEKAGDYAYYCAIHGSPTSGQRGVVHVTGIN